MLGGLTALAVACFFGVAWYTDHSGHGERAFLLLPLAVLLPLAFAGILSGLVARYHWPQRRWVAITTCALGVAFIAALWVWHV